LRRFVELQEDLQVNYCKLAVVSTDPPEVSAAFRSGLAATYTFLSDHERQAIRQLDIVEVTPPDFRHGLVALPYTFSLAPDLTIHAIYDGRADAGVSPGLSLQWSILSQYRACIGIVNVSAPMPSQGQNDRLSLLKIPSEP
jgi:hypothetical protein